MGETFAPEACLWNSKSDPDMDTRTIKATVGMSTNPIAIDDSESTVKESKLVTNHMRQCQSVGNPHAHWASGVALEPH